MIVRLIFAQYKQGYPGELCPNVVDAWDEYALDENYSGFEESLKKHEALVGEEYEWVKCLNVRVPDDAIYALPVIPLTDAEVS